MSTETRPSRLSRGDCVAAALEALALHGIQGVRVQTIAKELGVTTGSFYWHFRNRQELLIAVVDFWEASMTDSVMAGCARCRRHAGGAHPDADGGRRSEGPE